MVNAPAAAAIATKCMRDGCQYSPMMIPTRSMAKLQKNITIGLPTRTLSLGQMLIGKYL